MSGILDEKEKERLQKEAEKSGDLFEAEVAAEAEKELRELRNEIRYLVDKLKLDKYEFVGILGKLYKTRDLRKMTREQLVDVRNDLKGRGILAEPDLDEIERDVKEILKPEKVGEGTAGETGSAAVKSVELVPAVKAVVVPVIDEADAIKHFQRFQALKKAVLTDADYMFVGKDSKPCEKGKHVAEYIKKSGWRKIALMFNISVSVENEWQIEGEDKDGRWTGYAYQVKAIAPNGRFSEAVGTCTTRNKFFCKRYNEKLTRWEWIDTDPKNLIETAQTVAINRAISDLVGSGELSAEEVGE